MVPIGDAGNERNGVLDIEFYSLANVLLGSISVTAGGVFAWDQFHGFESNGDLIGRAVFVNVGHMVVDNAMFNGQVPEPTSLVPIGLGLAGLAAARRRKPA